MAIRNFWVEADIDGYKNNIEGGPRNKEDGMKVKIKQRLNGNIHTAFIIRCYVKDKNTLITEVEDENGNVVSRCSTER